MAKAKGCEEHEDNTNGCPECDSLRLLADVAPVPRSPHLGMDDAEVEHTEFEYSTRGPDDWVASGPLGESWHGTGRRFDTWRAAETWARYFYGEGFKGRKPDEPNSNGRWAFVVAGPRGTVWPRRGIEPLDSGVWENGEDVRGN